MIFFRQLSIKESFAYGPHEFWVVILSQPVAPGRHLLKLHFEGRLDNGILGYYKSVYEDEEGRERAIATSKFQPTYARRCFPCLDEPSFKSTFE